MLRLHSQFLPRNTACVCDRKRAVGSFRKHVKTDSRETSLENCSLVKGCYGNHCLITVQSKERKVSLRNNASQNPEQKQSPKAHWRRNSVHWPRAKYFLRSRGMDGLQPDGNLWIRDMFTVFAIYSHKFSTLVYDFVFYFFKKRDTLRAIPRSLQLWKHLCHITLVGADAWIHV